MMFAEGLEDFPGQGWRGQGRDDQRQCLGFGLAQLHLTPVRCHMSHLSLRFLVQLVAALVHVTVTSCVWTPPALCGFGSAAPWLVGDTVDLLGTTPVQPGNQRAPAFADEVGRHIQLPRKGLDLARFSG